MVKDLRINIFLLMFVFSFIFFSSLSLFSQEHYVIVGAFSTKVSANAEASRLKNSGFNKSGVLPPINSNLYKVFVDSFLTKESANTALKEYKLHFNDAWIFSASNKNEKVSESKMSDDFRKLQKQIDLYKQSLYYEIMEIDKAGNINDPDNKEAKRLVEEWKNSNLNNVNSLSKTNKYLSNKDVKQLKLQLDFYKKSLFVAEVEHQKVKNSRNQNVNASIHSEDREIKDSSKNKKTISNPIHSFNDFINEDEEDEDYIGFIDKYDQNEIKKSDYEINDEVLNNNQTIPVVKTYNFDSLAAVIKANNEEAIKEIDKKNEIQLKENLRNIEKLNDSIKSLELTFNHRLDSVQNAIDSIKRISDLGNSKFSFDLGVLSSRILSEITQPIFDYFSIDNSTNISNFYGFQIAGTYHFTPKWSAGLNVENYIYSEAIYGFPTLNVKYSSRIANSNIIISPFLGGGTNFILPLDSMSNIKAADYFKINGGIDIELRVKRNFSFFTTNSFNYSIPLNNKNKLDYLSHYNFIFGIRLNLLTKSN